MRTWEEAVEAAALRAQGWSIAAIARHLDRDPRRSVPPSTASASPASAARRGPIRLPRSPTTWRRGWPRTATCGRPRWTTLDDEVRSLGSAGSSPSFTRALRSRGLRSRGCGPVARPAPASPAARRSTSSIRIEHPHRASARCRAAVGLGRSARRALGGTAHVLDGACAGRGVVVLQPGPRGAGRGAGSAAPGRTWWRRWTGCCAALAARPAAGGLTVCHRDRPAHWPAAARLCRGRQGSPRTTGWALTLPAAAGQPHGRGGEGHPLHDAAVVAHRPARAAGRRAGIPGPLLGHHRRRPAPPRRPQCRRAGRHRAAAAAAAAAGRALPGHRRGRARGRGQLHHRQLHHRLPRQPLLRGFGCGAPKLV